LSSMYRILRRVSIRCPSPILGIAEKPGGL
jgi:hypothetical protein